MIHRPILYAEDREEDVCLLQFAFSKAEIPNPLRIATDGQEAIDYLSGTGKFQDRKEFPFPCLVLLDLKMPRKTGMEVLHWIRRESLVPWLIAIILSSSLHEGDVRRAYELGVNAFLIKPPDLNVLADMCRALKDFWLVHNEPPVQVVTT